MTSSLFLFLPVLQKLVTALVSAASDDFGVLDYSTTSAGAVLDTLALLSSNPDVLGADSQVGVVPHMFLPTASLWEKIFA